MRNNIDITKMTDAELRQLCEDAEEQFAPIEALIEANTSGSFACPHCAATASFNRDGSDWIAKCPTCDWDAAGFMGSKIPVN